jgi:hypothetical protein
VSGAPARPHQQGVSERDRVAVASRFLRDIGHVGEGESGLTTKIGSWNPPQLPIRDDDVGEELSRLDVPALGDVVARTNGQQPLSGIEVASDCRITSLVPIHPDIAPVDRWGPTTYPALEALWRVRGPDTPFSSAGPISANSTGVPRAASTTSWLTTTSPGLAYSAILAEMLTVRPK